MMNPQRLLLLALLASSLPRAAAQNTPAVPGSATSIAISGGTLVLSLDDPMNQTWTLQTSSSLDDAAWQAMESWKLHNGRFTQSLTIAPNAPRRFYRFIRDPGTEPLSSLIDTAVLLPASPFNYANPSLPPGFLVNPILAQDNTPANNRITDPAATLGRVLFYDKRLSRNQTISCSSCHQQAHGFSDPAQFSVGFEGGHTGRNSMGLANARYYLRRSFFWDERAATLESQVLQPIQDPVEMGMTLPELNARLAAEPFYQTLFSNAFGSPTVDSNRVARALAQFVRSIISTKSKFDAGTASGFTNFTTQENQGRQIFNAPMMGNCASCHGTDNFVPGNDIFNNGLENPYLDPGFGAVTGLTTDNGKFKVPSLRNIELTGPYMHDGRFATLEQVVEFYNSGVVNHPNLSPQLRNPPGSPGAGTPRRLNLNPMQKAALVAFLKTLTDPETATHPQWSDPFNYGQ